MVEGKIKSSAIVYEGPSLLHRSAPIVAIVTGLDGHSDNPKTQSMAQLWILRSDVSPLEAAQDGRDAAICGDCGLRGTVGGSVDRGCYVVIVNAPRAVYDAYSRNRYAKVKPSVINARLRDRGLSLRLGAYGDPAALPIGLLRQLTDGVSHTGYTHQWRKRPHLRSVVMASCDSVQDYEDATAAGWRSFRTRADAADSLQPGEIICPASIEAGHKSSCDKCSLCDGSHLDDRRKSIAIIAHGPTAMHAVKFIRSRSEVMTHGR